MTMRSKPVDRGTERGRRARISIGGEIRTARVNRNLTLQEVGRAVGVSIATASRLERGVLEHVDVMLLARMCAVVGLDLSVKAYPGGEPIRDSAQLALLRDFRALLHPSVDWATEVPLPGIGDPRAWDALIRGAGWRSGVEAETAPRTGRQHCDASHSSCGMEGWTASFLSCETPARRAPS
jgi:transcriptional regulator with XRE-family HTH domain